MKSFICPKKLVLFIQFPVTYFMLCRVKMNPQVVLRSIKMIFSASQYRRNSQPFSITNFKVY